MELCIHRKIFRVLDTGCGRRLVDRGSALPPVQTAFHSGEIYRNLIALLYLKKKTPNLTLNTVVVRGLPGSDLSVPFIRDGIQIWNHLPTNALNELLNNSEYIVARSGYSTIMDLLTVKKNAILVPTPGQTEQEYLGQYLHEKKWMYSVAQKNFNLQTAMNDFKKAELVVPEIPRTNLHDVIQVFLNELTLRKKNMKNQIKSFAR